LHENQSDQSDPQLTIAERFFTRPAMSRKLPEESTTARTALNVVQAEELLDGDPGRNLATFVTTFMEPEARLIIDANLHRNFIDHAEYPRTAEIARRCVRMLHDLFHGDGDPDEPGAACQGSSEAVMLGALAMKWRWKQARKKASRPDDKPNLVYGADVHVVWDKFCRYFDVEPRKIDVAKGHSVMRPEDLEPHIDDNTIGVVAVAGTTFTGECDDIPGIDEMLRTLRDERDLEVPMHVDAASGGFVFPFSDPDYAWDFRLKSVKSINVSGHKFGQVFPGVGWLVFRDGEQLPEDLVFYEDYLGERDATFTLNFSGSSAFVHAQYYVFIRLGKQGYRAAARTMQANADHLAKRAQETDALEIVGGKPSLPLIIARVREGEPFTADELVGELARRRGWLVPAYKMPPANEDQRIIRVLVKINQTRELADALADDIRDSVRDLRKTAAGEAVKRPVHTGHGY
jgi:glutamate decarboxylase